MKIVIKEIERTGENMLVYLMLDDNTAVKSEVTTVTNLNSVITKLTNGDEAIPKIHVNYKQYIKQNDY